MPQITIEETEYQELLMIKECAAAQASIQKKVGKSWDKYQQFQKFDQFARERYPSYRTMWNQFIEQQDNQ